MLRNQKNDEPIRTPIRSKVISEIQNELQMKLKGCSFLSLKTISLGPQQLPQFSRIELTLGSLVGIGTFSEIYEIKDIKCRSSFNNLLKPKGYKLNRRKMILNSNKEGSTEKKPFVLKHLRPSLLMKHHMFTHASSELILEANYLATFNHPNIISIRGVASGGSKAYANSIHDAFFIILDRMECTLSDHMRKWKKGEGIIAFAERLMIIRDLASAAAYLHDRCILYRDFKPANVGFDSFGNVKLLDFGLVTEVPKGGKHIIKRAGTPRYMAPECYMEKPYDYKADVYSITALLWEVLAIQRYFDTFDARQHVIYVFFNGARETLYSNWSAEIRSILEQGWAADPIERMTMENLRGKIHNEIENLRMKKLLDDKMIVDKRENIHVLQDKSLSGETECSESTAETSKFGVKLEI